MKYNIGDTVVIRADLYDDGEPYGEYLAVSDMVEYAGESAVIQAVHHYDGYYRINLDDGKWKWTDEMLYGVAIVNDESIESFGEVDLDAVIF